MSTVKNQIQIPEQFKKTISLLEGKWYVVASNLPMWLDGNHNDPSFNYTDFAMNGADLEFMDLVMYSKGGKEKKVKGMNRQASADKLEFIAWGKGLFGAFKSKWKVLASDPEGKWIAIHSPKTLVNPEGVDIICRQKKMSERDMKAIITKLNLSRTKKMIQLVKFK